MTSVIQVSSSTEQALEAPPASAPVQPVPRALRRRVLRAVRAEPKGAAARPWRRMRPVRTFAPARFAALGVAVIAAVAVLLAPDGSSERTIQATVGRAHLRVAGGHGELVVDRLRPLGSHRTYQLWLQSVTRRLVPSTLFGVTSRGTADLGVPGNLHGVARLLVTVEPEGGSLQPTTRPVIQLPLGYV